MPPLAKASKAGSARPVLRRWLQPRSCSCSSCSATPPAPSRWDAAEQASGPMSAAIAPLAPATSLAAAWRASCVIARRRTAGRNDLPTHSARRDRDASLDRLRVPFTLKIARDVIKRPLQPPPDFVDLLCLD